MSLCLGWLQVHLHFVALSLRSMILRSGVQGSPAQCGCPEAAKKAGAKKDQKLDKKEPAEKEAAQHAAETKLEKYTQKPLPPDC